VANRFFLIVALVLSLSACAHKPVKPDLTTPQIPQITFVDSQWNCDPKAEPLPDINDAKVWTDRQLFDKYVEAWKWGNRCDKQLQANKKYYEDSLKDRESLSRANPVEQKP
jgi:hypothetical protein